MRRPVSGLAMQCPAALMRYPAALVLMLFASVAFVSVARCQVPSRDLRAMAHTAHVELFLIAAPPVEKTLQDSAHQYILDYPITRLVLLPDSVQRLLRHALGDSASYIPGGNARQCEFQPLYGVRLGRRYQALISTGGCPRVGLYCRRSGKTVFCDLVDNSPVEQVLRGVGQ